MALRDAVEHNPIAAGGGLDGDIARPDVNLDANANAAVTPDVARAVLDAMASGAANPSSAHRLGAVARVILEGARDAVASLVDGAFEDGVVFTSGCTEANNAVLRTLSREPGAALIVSGV